MSFVTLDCQTSCATKPKGYCQNSKTNLLWTGQMLLLAPVLDESLQVRIVIMIEGKLGKDLQPNQITIVFLSQLFQKTKWMIFFSLLTLFSNSTNIRFDLIEFKTPQVCTITAQFIIKTNTFRESTIFMQGMFPPLRRCRPEQLWYFCLWEKTSSQKSLTNTMPSSRPSMVAKSGSPCLMTSST